MNPSISHHLRKIRRDAASGPSNRSEENSACPPPPAYTPKPNQKYEISVIPTPDSIDDLEDEDEDSTPHEITIDATTAISGSFNVLQLDVAAQGARLAAALASLLRESHNTPIGAAGQCPAPQSSTGGMDRARRRPMKITVNCGVRIHGQRNAVGVAPAAQQPVLVAPPPSGGGGGGGKRKAEDGEAGTESAVKCRAVGNGDRPLR